MKNILIMVKELQKELEAVNKELKTLPEGRLNKKGNFYYHLINESEIGITKKPEIISLLCRKRFLFARKKQLVNNISQPMYKFNDASPMEIINTLPRLYQELPKNYFFHPSLKDWLEQPYSENPYLHENRKYVSNNGIPLRSKSELIIANLLEDHHIPYRYDAEVKIENHIIYPDFIIKNPFTGEIVLWEHFGALHQADYEKKMTDKMNLYVKTGYIPFETIIYTFEFDIQNVQRLKDLIESTIL